MALATLDQLKSLLKIELTDTSNDVVLQMVLDAMEEAIICYTGPFTCDAITDEVHDGTISDTIVTDRSPIKSVQRVVFKCKDVEHELDSDSYYFDECSIMLKCHFTPRGRGVIEVDYTAGYDTVPADVILAHLEASKIYFQYSSNNQEHLQSVRKKDESIASGASTGSLFSPESGLPYSVEAKLKKYRSYCFPNAGMAQRNR